MSALRSITYRDALYATLPSQTNAIKNRSMCLADVDKDLRKGD